MKRTRFVFVGTLALLPLLPFSLRAAGDWVRYNAVPNSSRVKVDGTSTLHDWSVGSTALGGYVEFDAAFDLDKPASGKVNAHYYVISFLNRESTTLYSSRAANAAYCAADAGVFQKFVDVAFPAQPPEGSDGLTDDQLIALGRQAGATGPTFAQCVRTRKYNSFVNELTDTASRDGISGTPTVLVNNSQVQGLTADDLRSAIESALGT